MPKIRKILIANRGEIAIRVMRTCKELGIATVAVYSEADRSALHVRMADQAYLRRPAALARELPGAGAHPRGRRRSPARTPSTRATASSPRTPSSSAPCEKAGITFIGPPAAAMDAMGEKTRARAHMIKAGVPVVPGSDRALRHRRGGARRRARRSASRYAQGGGRRRRQGHAPGGGPAGLRARAWRGGARARRCSAFGNDAVYIEKYLEKPHHVEIQVFADTTATGPPERARVLGQRRHQKVVEETPAPILDPRACARRWARWRSRPPRRWATSAPGTVEFLVDVHRNFYFLEMNTRLQVEHPVTEWVTGLDLVALADPGRRGRAAARSRARSSRAATPSRCRIYAEDPARNFMPSAPAGSSTCACPAGPNVRDDSGVFAATRCPTSTTR